METDKVIKSAEGLLTDPYFGLKPLHGAHNGEEIVHNETEIKEQNVDKEDPIEALNDKRKQSLLRIDMMRKLIADFKGKVSISNNCTSASYDNMTVSMDNVKLSDESDKKKKTETKAGDKGAETYSRLCKKYKKVPINSVMKQFGKEVISLDGFDLSSKELKAFFVALLV